MNVSYFLNKFHIFYGFNYNKIFNLKWGFKSVFFIFVKFIVCKRFINFFNVNYYNCLCTLSNPNNIYSDKKYFKLTTKVISFFELDIDFEMLSIFFNFSKETFSDYKHEDKCLLYRPCFVQVPSRVQD